MTSDEAATALEDLMSELSERINRAGWDPGNESTIWGFAENPAAPYDDQGWGEIPLADRRRVAELRDLCGCWITCDVELPGGYVGTRRVPVDEYRKRLFRWRGQWVDRHYYPDLEQG